MLVVEIAAVLIPPATAHQSDIFRHKDYYATFLPRRPKFCSPHTEPEVNFPPQNHRITGDRGDRNEQLRRSQTARIVPTKRRKKKSQIIKQAANPPLPPMQQPIRPNQAEQATGVSKGSEGTGCASDLESGRRPGCPCRGRSARAAEAKRPPQRRSRTPRPPLPLRAGRLPVWDFEPAVGGGFC